MALNDKKCVPCERGAIPPLSMEQADKLLKNVPGWVLSAKANAIERKIKFKNFKQALAFVNKVGEIAEEQGHHPDFAFGWGYCHLTLTTHAIGGLHENDFIMAAKIEELLK